MSFELDERGDRRGEAAVGWWRADESSRWRGRGKGNGQERREERPGDGRLLVGRAFLGPVWQAWAGHPCLARSFLVIGG
jgi:hypothetical protein